MMMLPPKSDTVEALFYLPKMPKPVLDLPRGSSRPTVPVRK